MIMQRHTAIINTALEMEFDNYCFVIHLILISDRDSLLLHKFGYKCAIYRQETCTAFSLGLDTFLCMSMNLDYNTSGLWSAMVPPAARGRRAAAISISHKFGQKRTSHTTAGAQLPAVLVKTLIGKDDKVARVSDYTFFCTYSGQTAQISARQG